MKRIRNRWIYPIGGVVITGKTCGEVLARAWRLGLIAKPWSPADPRSAA